MWRGGERVHSIKSAGTAHKNVEALQFQSQRKRERGKDLRNEKLFIRSDDDRRFPPV